MKAARRRRPSPLLAAIVGTALLGLAATARAAATVEVTLVADPACAPGLRDVVTEQLSELARDVTWTCASRADEETIFRPTAREPADAQRWQIWLDVSLPTEMRLLLRDQAAGRFVVRRLALARGLDPVAREEIAQIVRAAALTIVSTPDETLTGTQARAAISAWPPRSAPDVKPADEARPKNEHARASAKGSASAFAFELGPLASARAFSRQIPVTGELGLLAQLSTGGALSVWIEGTYQLAARYHADPVGVDLSTLGARTGVALSLRTGRRLTLGAGAGLGAARVVFEPVPGAGAVVLASPSSFVSISARVLARAALELGPHAVAGLALFGDIATTHVHYDVQEPSGPRSVLAAFLVQPGIALWLAWRL